jgi:two-component system sensor histidine kinase KdpD
VLVVYLEGPSEADREEETFLQDLVEAAATPLSHATTYEREREAAEELRGLQELRSQLLAMVAHDLRTPLTVIKGIASMLRDVRASPERKDELLEIVDQQVERVNRLVTDILDLARLEAGRLKIVPERLKLRHAIEAALRGLPGESEVTIEIPVELEVLADPKRLFQVVVNLVSNALHHGAPPVTITGGRRDHEVSLEISDCGKGLPASRKGQPFEAFVPGETRGSVGLGLAIVRGLIEAHAGSVSYEDNEPRGARFVCTLPAPPVPGGRS